MLATLGKDDSSQLFVDVPECHRFPDLDLELPLSEPELVRQLTELSEKNAVVRHSFLGGGVYTHFIPAVVDALASRGEFLTSYTPYQPEVSQGTLQASFEYQSMVARLLGMDVVNASHYDGSTAIGEAVLMALRIARKKRRIVLGPGLNPEYRAVLQTYLGAFDVAIDECADDARVTELSIDSDVAVLVVQSPDFFGRIHDMSRLAERLHDSGGLLVHHTDPIAVAMLKTPGQWGADIATAEGQSLGIPVSFGGPYLGLFACRRRHMRKMPGRLAGLTTTSEGRRGFVLTLNTREQHIRRERATSNICTNQGLMSLRAAVYLAAMGPKGMTRVAELCYHRAHYAADRLDELPGVAVDRRLPFFREFVVHLPVDAEVAVARLHQSGIAAGIPLSRFYDGRPNDLLVAVTELNTRADIDALASALEGATR